jgi:hypothetical protein
MDLIKTIEEKVGIKKPEPYLKRLFDLNKGLVDHQEIANVSIVRTTSKQ